MSLGLPQQAESRREYMIAAAASELRDARSVFVGIGLPNVAANLARRTVAPSLELIYEAGVYGARPERVPISIGDPALVSGAIATMSMRDLFSYYLQAGRVDVGLLGSAQIDRWGNLNTTVIGDYASPRIRLPGAGGACDIALLAKRVVVLMDQSTRSFVSRVDFVTSPGHRGPLGEARSRLDWAGAGPSAVVTQLGCYRFVDGEMTLVSLHPGVALEEIDKAAGWQIRRAANITATDSFASTNNDS